jgi:hypothetical protein
VPQGFASRFPICHPIPGYRMKQDKSLGARLSPRQTHAYGPLKRAVKVLWTRAVDRRTRIGKAPEAWPRAYADRGGLVRACGPQQRMLNPQRPLCR